MINLFFNFFASLIVLSGFMVIVSKNPVHSVLFLVLVFCNAAGFLIVLGLDFFAMIFLVVYVGAIAVLFLFVVMMLNIKNVEINQNVMDYLPIGGIIGFIFLILTFQVIENDLIPIIGYSGIIEVLQYVEWPVLISTYSNIESIGILIYTYYFLFFQLAGLILLVAMIGAIVLTMRRNRSKRPSLAAEQINRDFTATLRKHHGGKDSAYLAMLRNWEC